MRVVHVFCDESHSNPGQAFRLQGGIWIPQDAMRAVRDRLRAHHAKHPVGRRYKWEKANGRTLRRCYRDMVDIFFESAAAGQARFRCIVVSAAQDPSRDSGGAELGFYKAYHLLFTRRFMSGCAYHVVLDRRSNREADREAQLRSHVNATLARMHPERPPLVMSCRAIASGSEDLLQLADLLLGAVGWAWNGHRPNSSPAKRDLADHIATKLGWPGLDRETARDDRPFDIWRYRRR